MAFRAADGVSVQKFYVAWCQIIAETHIPSDRPEKIFACLDEALLPLTLRLSLASRWRLGSEVEKYRSEHRAR